MTHDEIRTLLATSDTENDAKFVAVAGDIVRQLLSEFDGCSCEPDPHCPLHWQDSR